MKNNNRYPINKMLESRSGLFELVIMAVLITSGINFVTTGISSTFSTHNQILIFAGIFLVIIGLIYLTAKVFGNKNIKFNTNGFFVYHKKNKKIVPVERYDASTSTVRYLEALFIENKALENLWNREDFTERYSFENDNLVKKEIKSDQLIVESLEYFIISKLSTHLRGYFNKYKTFDKLRNFSRNEVPDVLLSNRFLELFSKPMEEREPFVEFTEKKGSRGKTISAYSKGAIFDLFELTLPKRSIVKRVAKNQVLISTRRFKMRIETSFDGMGDVLPYKFEKFYLLLDRNSDISVYGFQIRISISFNILSFLSVWGWRYYRWVDSFLMEINKKIDKDTFFRQINWESNVTLYEMLDKKMFMNEANREIATDSE